ISAVVGDKFLARDLTINTSPPEKHQAVALRVTSNASFYRCEIISHQDTLYAHLLHQFYHDCTIQGTIDFIFGNAAAVFQNCTILARREDPNQNKGISLQNCTIEAAKEFNLTDRKNITSYLGRPWRNYSRTVVVSSYLGDLIKPRGRLEWDEYSSLDTVEYVEYMNSGPVAGTDRRVLWGGYRRNCSEDMVRQFGVEEFLHGADNWLVYCSITFLAILEIALKEV
ncbi:probable pectinesterase/pectinesterase inhibitor 25, partial [Phtheirospermum japonicum]